jgi:CPA1 family monovalent cation:H+ antiporter
MLLTAFSVVLGTLVIQGLTLKPLLRALNWHDDDPVGRGLHVARERALQAGLASVAHDQSSAAEVVRQELAAHLAPDRTYDAADDATRLAHGDLRRGAVQAARQAVLAIRANNEIGDESYSQRLVDWTVYSRALQTLR